MLPKEHMLYGIVFAFITNLFIFPGLNLMVLALIFLSTFAVDADHYLIYVYRHRDLSLKRAYNYFTDMCEKLKASEKHMAPLLVFHTVEFMAILVVLAFYSKYFAFIAAGVLFHVLLDHYSLSKDKIASQVSRSIIYHHLTKHKYKIL